jgi:hypothetical protein
MSEGRRGRGRPSFQEVLNLLDEEVGLLKGSLGGLPRAVEADEILHAIWLDDVHNSTAIEGNTMTRAQVKDLVERGRASARLIENLEVKGYADAADRVYRHAPDYPNVPVQVVSEAHKLAVKLAWDLEPPATRDEPGRGGRRRWRCARSRSRFRPRSPPSSRPGANRPATWPGITRSSMRPFTRPSLAEFQEVAGRLRVDS